MLGLLASLALKASAILAGGAAVTVAARKAPASARYLTWTLAFCALLLLPALHLALPRWEVPVLPAHAGTPSVVGPESVSEPAGQAMASQAIGAAAPDEGRRTSGGFGRLLGSLWLLGAALLLVRLMRSMAKVRRIARTAEPAGPELHETLEAVRARLGIRRPIRLLTSPAVFSPMTWGITRPVVVTPPVADRWSAHRKESILLHEAVHVRRADYAVQLVTELVCALYWFHPLVWIGARRLRMEREHAADDAVLLAGTRPSDYADHLLAVAHATRPEPGRASLAVAVAEASRVGDRLSAILDSDRRRHGIGLRMGIIATLASGFAVLLLSAAVPTARPVSAGEPRAPLQVPGPPPEAPELPWAAFATELVRTEDVPRTARTLAGADGALTLRKTSWLRQLSREPGLTIYVDFRRVGTPVRLTVEPHDGMNAVLLLGGERFLSAGPETTQTHEGGLVAIFQVNGPDQDQYLLRVPAEAKRITVVADGRPYLEFSPIEPNPRVVRLDLVGR